MNDYYYAADPAFYDNSEWVTCDTCEREYDRREYNSDTCVECENKLTIKERGQVMNKWTVWVGGSEVNSYYLTRSQAISIARDWFDRGYDDVVVEEIK